MWKIKDLKNRAWRNFGMNYWNIFLVCFILTFVMGTYVNAFMGSYSFYIPSSISNIINDRNDFDDDYEYEYEDEYEYDDDYDDDYEYDDEYEYDDDDEYDYDDEFPEEIPDLFNNLFNDLSVEDYTGIFLIVGGILLLYLIILLVFMAYRVFLGYPLEVGGRNFFKNMSLSGHSKLSDMGYCFKNGNYFPVVKSMFVKGLFLCLWSLLIIIPYIIAFVIIIFAGGDILNSTYYSPIMIVMFTILFILFVMVFLIPYYIKIVSYSMVPYILSDNPKIGPLNAMKLSSKMVSGHKLKIVGLWFSLLGWIILGVMTCIGLLFIQGYFAAIMGELYKVLRKNAIDEGICSAETLNLNEDQNNHVQSKINLEKQ
ncbi:MAG: DUF975 family protein [Clostridiales bacterium]